MKLIAVADCEIALSVSGQDVTSQSSFSLSPASTDVLSESNGVYFQGMKITVSLCSYLTYNLVAPVQIDITASGSDVLDASDNPVVLEKDEGSSSGTFLNSSSPYDTQTYTIKAVVNKAGSTSLQYLE